MPSEASASTPEARTVRGVLEAAARRLAAAGVPAPRDDARRLWAALAGDAPGDVWLADDEPAPAGLVDRFERAVSKRAAGAPAAYASGLAGFRTLDLEVNERTLIPRPETEGLVEEVLAWCRRRAALAGEGGEPWGDALDVGTGSGCIALSLAVEGRFRRVVATEPSGEATRVARRNVQRVRPPVPVEIRPGAFFEPVGGERFLVIVANPPYLSEDEFAATEDSVRRFEPKGALVSPEGGMWHLGVLVGQAAPHLVPGGLLALEVDCRRAERTAALARDAGWCGVVIRPDLFGRERYLLATRELVQ